MPCSCAHCKHLTEFQTRLNAIPEEHHPFFEDLMDRYQTAQMDSDVSEAILNGTWPSAKESIENAALKLGYKLVPLTSD